MMLPFIAAVPPSAGRRVEAASTLDIVFAAG
jgi:hypothetical protein